MRSDLPQVVLQEARHGRGVVLPPLALHARQEAGAHDPVPVSEDLANLHQEAVGALLESGDAQGNHEGVAHHLCPRARAYVTLAIVHLLLQAVHAPVVEDVPEARLQPLEQGGGELHPRLGGEAGEELVDVEGVGEVASEHAGLVDVPMEGRAVVRHGGGGNGEAVQRRRQERPRHREHLRGRHGLQRAEVRPDRPERRLAAPVSGLQRQLGVAVRQRHLRSKLSRDEAEASCDHKVHEVPNRPLLEDRIAGGELHRLDDGLAERLHGKRIKNVQRIQKGVGRQMPHAPAMPKSILQGVGQEPQVFYVLRLQPLPLIASGLDLQLDCQGQLRVHGLLVQELLQCQELARGGLEAQLVLRHHGGERGYEGAPHQQSQQQDEHVVDALCGTSG
mmetsp:Transcript_20797/g.58577  ORF Transcript_20797/g.58577 Transcript_20797/m.58577 type:complete len:391 (+) Transcript_20797:606-1778(+)